MPAGGTLPLLQAWLMDGMSMGSAAAFMVTGPSTKITNLGALKIVLGIKNFVIYIVFVMLFSFATGLVVKFLEESKFEAGYLYIILTYGHDESDSPEFTARLAEKYGVFVDYIAAIKMVDNYLPVFDMEEETVLEKHVEEQMETAVRAVSERKHGIQNRVVFVKVLNM